MSFGFGKPTKTTEIQPTVSGGYNFNQVAAANSASGQTSYLASGSVITGQVKLVGTTTVNCKVEGPVTAGALTVGPEGEIIGNVIAQEIIIEGKVLGDIDATDRISLKRAAHVQGNLKCAKISIEDGAVFNGVCAMNSNSGVVSLSRDAATI